MSSRGLIVSVEQRTRIATQKPGITISDNRTSPPSICSETNRQPVSSCPMDKRPCSFARLQSHAIGTVRAITNKFNKQTGYRGICRTRGLNQQLLRDGRSFGQQDGATPPAIRPPFHLRDLKAVPSDRQKQGGKNVARQQPKPPLR